MNKPRILLAMTGSVATILADKIIPALQEIGEVKVIMTEAAIMFADPLTLHKRHAVDVYTQVHEWTFHPLNDMGVFNGHEHTPDESRWTSPGWWQAVMETQSADDWITSAGHHRWLKDDKILHIELRKWADVLVIAPLTANTLAKMAVGISDNLVTSVFRAWDKSKPVIVAPAMNTEMWDVNITEEQLETLRKRFNPVQKSYHRNQAFDIVYPVEKELACGDKGMGALAPISDIAERVKDSMRWLFPLVEEGEPYSHKLGIPKGNHPGAFAYHRHKAHHTGVDLYTDEDAPVYAVEGGVVVGIQGFTGAKVGMDWWNETDAVLVEGRSGVVNYGEIRPRGSLKIGSRVLRGQVIGWVTPVVKAGKERPDVPGHSRSMLHLELYPHGHKEWVSWPLEQEEHSQIDPTPLLLKSIGAPEALPEFEGEL